MQYQLIKNKKIEQINTFPKKNVSDVFNIGSTLDERSGCGFFIREYCENDNVEKIKKLFGASFHPRLQNCMPSMNVCSLFLFLFFLRIKLFMTYSVD